MPLCVAEDVSVCTWVCLCGCMGGSRCIMCTVCVFVCVVENVSVCVCGGRCVRVCVCLCGWRKMCVVKRRKQSILVN